MSSWLKALGEIMNYCPCCSDVLLQHIRIHEHETYWFCRNCWQEMPVLGISRTRLSSPSTIYQPAQLVVTKKIIEEIYACA